MPTKAVDSVQAQLQAALTTRCKQLGLMLPEYERKFHASRKWRIDAAWPSLMVAVEFDGGYAQAKGGHTTIGGFLKDMEKHNALNIQGWCLLRFPPKDMLKNDKAITVIQSVIADRLSTDNFNVIKNREQDGW